MSFPEVVYGQRRSVPRDGLGYVVVRGETNRRVKAMACMFCGHYERACDHHGRGRGRYNKMRAAMLVHVYAAHGDAIRALLKQDS